MFVDNSGCTGFQQRCIVGSVYIVPELLFVPHPLIKTRIAPTPSGFLHLGNALSFAVTAAVAKRHNAELLLRIDDLDSDRVKPEFVADIFETMTWLDLNWKSGPTGQSDLDGHWSQRFRVSNYDDMILQLLIGGHVYPCSCSRKEIDDRGGLGSADHQCRNKMVDPGKKNVSWRIKLPEKCAVPINDAVRGKVLVDLNSEMPDFVIRRRDGIPSYQIASLADDIHFGINLVVRGEDLLASTAAQLYLAKVTENVDFETSTFLHHPLIKATDGSKLSKSLGSDALKTMREKGMRSAEIFQLIGSHLGIESQVVDIEGLSKALDPQLHLRG